MLAVSLLFSLISFTLTFIFTPVVMKFAVRFGLVDDPAKRTHPAHTHKGIIPRAGGFGIFLGIVIPVLLFFPKNSQIIGILIGSSILTLSGLWDDKKSRSPYIRFIINCVAAIVVVVLGVTIPYVTNPFGGIFRLDSFYLVAEIFTTVWILWNTNIIGWSGGVDGQLPGFVSITAFIIGLLSFRFAIADPNQLAVTYLSFLTAGAFLGFLPWNFYPQKIMPGYGGKTLAGFLLGVLSVLAFGKLGTALLVLAVPMSDAVFVFGTRLLHGKSPVWASKGHLHHHLLSLGWGKRRIALFYWSVSAAAGVVALTFNSKQKVFAFLIILVLIFGIIWWVRFIRRFVTPESDEAF